MDLGEFQQAIRATYVERDALRGVDGTFRWLVEEVGELARTIRHHDHQARTEEIGDVLAWLASVGNLLEVDLEEAAARYARGCPRCGQVPCTCPRR